MEHGVESLTEKRRHCNPREFVCLFEDLRFGDVQVRSPGLVIPRDSSVVSELLGSVAKTLDSLSLSLSLALINTAIFLPSQSISCRRQTPRKDGWAHPKNTSSEHDAAKRHPPANPPPDVRPGSPCHIARSHYHRRT
jgi:hypothetical protein